VLNEELESENLDEEPEEVLETPDETPGEPSSLVKIGVSGRSGRLSKEIEKVARSQEVEKVEEKAESSSDELSPEEEDDDDELARREADKKDKKSASTDSAQTREGQAKTRRLRPARVIVDLALEVCCFVKSSSI
jgi:hypothetical protein